MKKVVSILDGLLDNFLEYPFVWDITIATAMWLCSKNISIISFTLTDRTNQITLLPYLISSDVTLAGFILAALTIIVTFKSNLKAKGMEEAGNALELILSSDHYNNIVKVFKKSMIELVCCFVLLFIAWASVDNFSINTINRINCVGILVTSLAISRSLFVLFVILNLERHEKEK